MGNITMNVKRLRHIAGRYYWRPSATLKAKGFHAEPLGADPVKAITRAQELNRRVEGDHEPGLPRETVTELIRLYTSDPLYAEKADKTKQIYGRVLDEIERKAGDVDVCTITRKQLRHIYRAMLPRGEGIASMHMTIWRILLNFAIEEEWIDHNPAAAMRIRGPNERDQVWSGEQVRAFCDAAIAAGRPSVRLAALLGYYTGHRPGDLLSLTWRAYKGGFMTILQSKTKKTVELPVMEPLREALDSTVRTSTHILVNDTTRQPWNETTFRSEFRRIARLAGLPDDLQFRDFRRTMATELGESSATDDEIRAVTGHRDRNVVARYVRPNRKMAENAIARLDRKD